MARPGRLLMENLWNNFLFVNIIMLRALAATPVKSPSKVIPRAPQVIEFLIIESSYFQYSLKENKIGPFLQTENFETLKPFFFPHSTSKDFKSISQHERLKIFHIIYLSNSSHAWKIFNFINVSCKTALTKYTSLNLLFKSNQIDSPSEQKELLMCALYISGDKISRLVFLSSKAVNVSYVKALFC